MERVIKLHNNTKQILGLLQTGITLPSDHLKSAWTAVEEFLVECLKNPGNKLILDAITKMAEDSKKRDKNIIDNVKNVGSLPASSVTSTSSSGRSWASVLGGVPLTSNTRVAGGMIIPQDRVD